MPLDQAMQFCRDQRYRRVFQTTPSGLEAAMRLYATRRFIRVAAREEAFHGSSFVEQILELKLE